MTYSTQNLEICDFFSGLHSWTKPLEGMNVPHSVFSIDNNPAYEDDTTIIGNFLALRAHHVLRHFQGRRPYAIVASPPCTTFSVASIGKHWTGGHRAYIPKTEASENGLRLLHHTIKLIRELRPHYFIIENPRGVMRKMPIMEELDRVTVWYCRYGPTQGILRAKPTDLWGGFPPSWTPREPCKNGNPECSHVRAPRGAKTGTQGLSGNAARSEIPTELTGEIMASIVHEWNHYRSIRGSQVAMTYRI